jgi:plasmid stabilization system protein ParE
MSRICRITPRASRDIETIADYLSANSSLSRVERFLNGINATLLRISKTAIALVLPAICGLWRWKRSLDRVDFVAAITIWITLLLWE